MEGISKNRLIADLRRIGLREGDHVAVALSFKSLGFVCGGPEVMIDALLEVVGPNGTIMMNTHTYGFPISKIKSNFIFDPKSTKSWTGLVPETLRRRAEAVRSWHPISSVTAIGKFALMFHLGKLDTLQRIDDVSRIFINTAMPP